MPDCKHEDRKLDRRTRRYHCKCGAWCGADYVFDDLGDDELFYPDGDWKLDSVGGKNNE